MKLQGLGIVFAIIILPVIIILSYYIHLSVDTIALQTSYKSKLNDSTYDSMLAFEMNTANENLSSVADSLRSIIEASNSVFFDSLASNFGMSNASKNLFQAYVPAILYTLYDGYYIYAPTKQPEILTYQDWMLSELTFDASGNIKIGSGDANEITINRDTIESSGGQPIYTPDGRFIYRVKNGITTASPEGYIIGNRYYTTTLNDNVNYKVDYVLKSYMPYAARYVHNDTDQDIDVTINYTLDNYLNIMGNINGVYYSKTGYLINTALIRDVKITDKDGNNVQDNFGRTINGDYLLSLNEDEAEEICLSGEYRIELTINCSSGDTFTIVSNPRELDNDPNNIINTTGAREEEIQRQLNADYEKWHSFSYPKKTGADDYLKRIRAEESELANIRAVAYYVRNYIFSKWVYENLGVIEAKDINNDIINSTVSQYSSSTGSNYSNKAASIDTLFQVFNGDKSKIFDEGQDPEIPSNFLNHKDGVIRNSIQYNLDVAFSSYTDMYSGNLSFQMPVISDSEWERIITNVSVVSFMQGMPCGTKNFNSYSIVNSTNNELTVIPSEMFYIPSDQFSDETSYAHRVDCEKFPTSANYGLKPTCSSFISIKSNEVKYDGIYNKNQSRYEYTYRNLLDYWCIINKNLRESEYDIGGTNDRVQLLNPAEWIGEDPGTNNKERRAAYYTGIAEQRQKLYKTNALTESSGYTYQSYLNNAFTTSNLSGEGAFNSNVELADGKVLDDVKEFEIYLNTFQVSVGNSTTIKLFAKDQNNNVQQLELYSKDAGGNDKWVTSRSYSNLTQGNGTNLTVRARCHAMDMEGSSNQIQLIVSEESSTSFVHGVCVGVKTIYK